MWIIHFNMLSSLVMIIKQYGTATDIIVNDKIVMKVFNLNIFCRLNIFRQPKIIKTYN